MAPAAPGASQFGRGSGEEAAAARRAPSGVSRARVRTRGGEAPARCSPCSSDGACSSQTSAVCPFISLKVKPMDNEEEKAASEEKDHKSLPEATEKEKGIVFALLECVGVFSGGFVSILSVLETKQAIKNIVWTTAKDFTVERGRQQIEELISVSYDPSTQEGHTFSLLRSMKN